AVGSGKKGVTVAAGVSEGVGLLFVSTQTASGLAGSHPPQAVSSSATQTRGTATYIHRRL
ncbi:MAG: hypothetical protein U1B80_00040, partial [Anaerolineaceae bacterium]|nr:hypothetical protein [Anaerolineaceae bacterium]